MKAVFIISSRPDILFVWEDNDFARHINKVLYEAGFIDCQLDMTKLDHGAMAQYFSPMIASLTYMNDIGNPYSSITCKDGTMFVFQQYDNMTFIAINGSGDESEDFLKRKLTVVQRLATMHYGASLELLKVELPSARKKAWQTLGELIDAWQLLYTQQQSFLVEAIEHIQVNQSLSEMAVSLLQEAVMATTKSKSEQNAVHALLLVNAKLFALYSSRNASELQAADILMITVIVQRIFPHSSLAIPSSSTRPPPPLAHYTISSGGPSSSQSILNGNMPDHHHPSSTPIAINRSNDADRHSASSSNEDKFYSPPSTPTKHDLVQETIKTIRMTNEEFFSPRTNTPPTPQEYSDNVPADDSVTSEENSSEDVQEIKKEYFRQLIFLNTPRCPYTPNMLHLVHIAAGTVLVLVNEVKYSPVAVSIYQILNIISRIETDERKPTPQQANVTMEKIEASIRKIIETLRNSMGTALENRLRKVRESWKMVKRSDLNGFLCSQLHELPPGLDASVNDMIRSLKSMFSVLFLTGSYNDNQSNDRHIQTICHIRDNIRTRLSDYEDYLQVKGERNITMTAYLEDYPGLVHFIHVDRSGNQVTAPSLNTSQEQASNPRDPCHVLKQKIWDAWNLVNVFVLQGNTFIALRDGDFLYTYCLWFEDTSGNPAVTQSSLPVLPGSSPPGILSGDDSYFKHLIQRCFPAAQEGTIRCYELLCMHVGLVPIRLAAKHIRKLATTLFESSLGAHFPISLLE